MSLFLCLLIVAQLIGYFSDDDEIISVVMCVYACVALENALSLDEAR